MSVEMRPFHQRTGLRVTALTFDVELLEDLAIGGGIPVGDEDRPIVTDGLGRPIIPGSSLAGVLRDLARRHLGDGLATALFGDPGNGGGAGRLEVDDIVLDTRTLSRDGVGIDRFTGAAATNILYNLEVVPAGGAGGGEVRLRSASGRLHNQLIALFRQVVVENLLVGSGTTRGRGTVAIDDVVVRTRPVADRNGLGEALGIDPTGDGARSSSALPQPLDAWEPLPEGPGDSSLPEPASTAAGVVAVTVPFTAVTPVFTASSEYRDGHDGVGGKVSRVFDTVPLVEEFLLPAPGQHRGPPAPRVRLLLPGTSVKGALRSHAEMIERTVRGSTLPGPAADGTAFLGQLDGSTTPITEILFGSALRDSGGERAGRRALLSVRSTRSRWSCDAGHWDAIVSATRDKAGNDNESAGLTGDLRERLRTVSVTPQTSPGASCVLRAGSHIAIDRWSGGVKDRALFTILEPHAVSWQPIDLRLDLPDRHAAAVSSRWLALDHTTLLNAALALLLLVLRDVAHGRVPLGAGGNRGYGAIAADPADIALNGLPSPDEEVPTLAGLFNPTNDSNRQLVATLAEAWQTSAATEVRRPESAGSTPGGHRG